MTFKDNNCVCISTYTSEVKKGDKKRQGEARIEKGYNASPSPYGIYSKFIASDLKGKNGEK